MGKFILFRKGVITEPSRDNYIEVSKTVDDCLQQKMTVDECNELLYKAGEETF